MSPPGEFEYIERIRSRLPALPAGWVGPGDDGAVLDDGLVMVTDTMVDGVHARLDWCTPADFGWKAMAVNVSDLAAMGAEPLAAVCAVTLPRDAPESLRHGGEPGRGLADGLADGLLEAAETMSCHLVGGDVTSGPVLVVTVTALGRVQGQAVLRSGAHPGDTIVVTGPLGGPAAAVATLTEGDNDHPGVARLHRPSPRVRGGLVTRATGATAMIDISDGLAADLGHICDESGVGVHLDGDLIPISGGATLAEALSGGDDYELAICTRDPDRLVAAFAEEDLPPPIVVGEITSGPDRLVTINGDTRPLRGGWTHDLS